MFLVVKPFLLTWALQIFSLTSLKTQNHSTVSLLTGSSILHCLSESGISASVCFLFISIGTTGLRPTLLRMVNTVKIHAWIERKQTISKQFANDSQIPGTVICKDTII